MFSYIKRILQILLRLGFIIMYKLACKKNELDPRGVLLTSLSRNSLSGNLLYVHDELVKDSSYTVRQFFSSKKKLSFSQKKQLAALLAQSAYVMIDDFYALLYPLKFREGTKLIQVWHAMGAFKTFGFARNDKQDRYSLTHRNYDYAIVSSRAITKDYARSYGISEDKVLPLGIPRTDIFFDDGYAERVRRHYLEKYPQLRNKKIILFAPTFRGTRIPNGYYDFEKASLERLRELGKEYICIIKLHPYIANSFINPNPDFFLDLTAEREINDLLFITDTLITDYSSVIFEASLLNLKTIFYVFDLEQYDNGRGFFYPFSEYTYGPVCRDIDSVIQNIKHYPANTSLESFREKFTSACDGRSSERVIDVLIRGKKHE